MHSGWPHTKAWNSDKEITRPVIKCFKKRWFKLTQQRNEEEDIQPRIVRSTGLHGIASWCSDGSKNRSWIWWLAYVPVDEDVG